MTLAARKSDKRVHFGTPKQVFFNHQVESIIETGEIIQLSAILKAATRITPYVKCTLCFTTKI